MGSRRTGNLQSHGASNAQGEEGILKWSGKGPRNTEEDSEEEGKVRRTELKGTCGGVRGEKERWETRRENGEELGTAHWRRMTSLKGELEPSSSRIISRGTAS